MRERRHRTEQLVQHCDVQGAWRDVGAGECERCGTERRLYQPADAASGATTFNLRVCAPCTQVLCKSTLTMKSRDEVDDRIEALEADVAPAETPLRRSPKKSERLATIVALASSG